MSHGAHGWPPLGTRPYVPRGRTWATGEPCRPFVRVIAGSVGSWSKRANGSAPLDGKKTGRAAPVRPTIHSWARAIRGDGAPMVQGHTAVGGGSGDAHTTSCRPDRVALGHGQPRMQTMDPFRRRPAHESAVARPTNHTQHRRAHILRGTFVHPSLARQPSEEGPFVRHSLTRQTSEEGPFVHPPLPRQPSKGTPITLSHIKQRRHLEVADARVAKKEVIFNVSRRGSAVRCSHLNREHAPNGEHSMHMDAGRDRGRRRCGGKKTRKIMEQKREHPAHERRKVARSPTRTPFTRSG